METFGAQRNVTNADAEQFCSSNTENNQPISDEIECEKRCVKLKTILKGIRNQNFGADNILNEYLLDGDILFPFLTDLFNMPFQRSQMIGYRE